MSWPFFTLLAIMLASTALFALTVFEFLSRENRIGKIELLDRDDSPIDIASPHFQPMFELFTNASFKPGHTIEILTNGDETYPRLLEDLRSAERLITWHVFQFVSGRLADEVIDTLVERAQAGVRVLVLIDAFGSLGLKKKDRQRLMDGGVTVKVFRPFHWRVLYKIQDRMHMRAVVIDGRIGWTGGFGIDDHWLGSGRKPGEWRDTNARLVGPAVSQLQASFAANWAESTGVLLMGDELLPALDPKDGGETCGIIHTAPSLGSTNAERYFVLAIACAAKKLYITNPYFIPDDDLRSLLADAVKRGVDVRVLNPGPHNDRRMVFHASRRHYEELLRAGIRIWEYGPSMIHAKTIVGDGSFFSVGTINFDNRSIMLNDEVALCGLDDTIAAELEQTFLEDLRHSNEIALDEFVNRPLTNRMKERFCVTFQSIL